MVSCPKFAINIMINNYKNIIHKSKVRDAKVIENFKKYFLPEKYLDSYLKIADFMTDKSIENIVNSVFTGGKIEGVKNQSRILFIYGTKGNEVLSNIAKSTIRDWAKKYSDECQYTTNKKESDSATEIRRLNQKIKEQEKEIAFLKIDQNTF